MKNLTTNNMRKSNIIVIVAILFGLNACSDDFPKPSIGRYCGTPKDCKPPTEEVDISNIAWDSFTEEEKKEIQQKGDELSGSKTAQQETEPEMVGGYSKSWHDQMRLQAEDAAKEEHPFDLPEGWQWTEPNTHKAGPYNPDVYEDFPWPVIWEYRKFKGTEKEARDFIYEIYQQNAEIFPDDEIKLNPEFKEMEISGNKAYVATILAMMPYGDWNTELIVFKNGQGYYFHHSKRIDELIPEMTVVISSLK